MLSRIIKQLEGVGRLSRTIIINGIRVAMLVLIYGCYCLATEPLLDTGNTLILKAVGIFQASLLIGLVIEAGSRFIKSN